MVKYPVQHNLHIMLVKIPAHLGKILICTETAVNLAEIPCIIPMVVRLKNGVQKYGINTQFL